VSFEQPIIGPATNWAAVPATNNTLFASSSASDNGWYLITYKVDIRTSGPDTSMRAAAALIINGAEVTGSGTSAQAPDTNHQYSISNTVLVQYTVGDQLGVQWWAANYTGTTITNATALSVGPNPSGAETPWIDATLDPSGAFTEATAAVVITRIVAL